MTRTNDQILDGYILLLGDDADQDEVLRDICLALLTAVRQDYEIETAQDLESFIEATLEG